MAAVSTAASVVSFLSNQKNRHLLTMMLTIPAALLCVVTGLLFYRSENPNDVYRIAVTSLAEEEQIEGTMDGELIRTIELLHSGTISDSTEDIMDHLRAYFLKEDERKVSHTVIVSGVGHDGKPFEREEIQTSTESFLRFVNTEELLERLTEAPFFFEDSQLEIVRLYLELYGTAGGTGGESGGGGSSFTGQFIMPCEGYISSPWGYRTDPFGGQSTEKHTGIDIRGNWHQPIRAVADGVVYQVNTRFGSYGNYVMIRHEIGGRTFYSFYAHMSAVRIQQGTQVAQGTIIGLEGGEPGIDQNHGDSTGHHLHFEIRLTPHRNSNVDPAGYLNGLGETSYLK